MLFSGKHKGKCLLGLLLGAGGYMWWAGRLRRDKELYFAVAFKDKVAVKDSPTQVRDAGPEATKDDDGRGWSYVDQASDESFPASDPPARY